MGETRPDRRGTLTRTVPGNWFVSLCTVEGEYKLWMWMDVWPAHLLFEELTSVLICNKIWHFSLHVPFFFLHKTTSEL